MTWQQLMAVRSAVETSVTATLTAQLAVAAAVGDSSSVRQLEELLTERGRWTLVIPPSLTSSPPFTNG